jgi:hypothetical protein
MCNEKNGGTNMSSVIWKDDKETEIVLKVKDSQVLTDAELNSACGGVALADDKKENKKEDFIDN